MDRRDSGILVRVVRGCSRPAQARIPEKGALMIGLEVLYGFAGLLTVILFAYLVFALICAEEF